MKDKGRGEEEPGKSSNQPAAKGPGEFTRLFFVEQPLQYTNEPSQPLESVQADSPGEFTRMFGSSGNATPDPPGSPGSVTGEFPLRVDQGTDLPTQAAPNAKTDAEPPADPEALEKAFTHPLAPPSQKSLDIEPGRVAHGGQPEGFTQLFSAAPASSQLNTMSATQKEVRVGTSDYTRVIRSSEVRAAMEKQVIPVTPPAPQSGPGLPQAPAVQYQPVPMPALQYPIPQMPPQPAMQYSMLVPQPYAPQVQAPQMPAVTVPGFQAPSTPQPASAANPAGSKWIAYLPVLIVINILFMVAVLLILFFALRK